ncbi:mitogen-activated protein kinase kinase kinase 5-like [Chenopodium quinoa]|uniref:mitogen-activated protein kinase kinase kinase 5-like n=1 Tax=Chenopodium quinoa TaxID=63459 RepID=UPI000B7897FF|nr:mitogen-activated protein kinase kinase kinase 5-like [Chenopodium quinoa]
MNLPRWSFSSSNSSSTSNSNTSTTSNNRRLTRAKQLRHLRDCDLSYLDFFLGDRNGKGHGHRHGDDLLRTASSPPPQPLPLPEIISGEDKSVSKSKTKSKSKPKRGDCENFRLPSPTEVSREKERGFDNNNKLNACKVASQIDQRGVAVDAQKRVSARQGVNVQTLADPQSSSVHRTETWPLWNVPQKIQSPHRPQENYSIDINFQSAPPSSSSSPMYSPQRMLNGDPFFMYPMEPARWSEPAMPTGFPYGGLPESTMASRDSPSFRSPLLRSPRPPRNSISGPPSPLHPRLSVEISSPHHDFNVHPLPLPPTPSSSMLASPVPQVSSRPEVLPMKSQWIKGKLIGRGTFGSVYAATNRETGALCAMKEVDLIPDDQRSAECMRQLEQEIEVLSHLKHPNIVQYYGSEIVDDKFYIYLEYVYPGSINKYIREHCGAITEAVVRNFTRHIVSGLAYLHSRKTIHRDIKGANLLVDSSGVVKLADFGMAKPLSEQSAILSLKGSPYWMAPELMQSVIQNENSSDLAFAVDIWSLGCTIIEMLTGKPPWSEFEGAAAMFKVLKESPPIPETLSPEGKDFLHCCFQRDPADRPPAIKLLDHLFLRTSQQMDLPSSRVAPDLMIKMDKVAHSSRETYGSNLEKVLLSPRRWATNGRGYI